MTTEDTKAAAVAGPMFTEGLGPTPPERATVLLSLADLGVLAATAERNGTTRHFPEVALHWAAGAQAEIERLRQELDDAKADYMRLLREKQDGLLSVAAEREQQEQWKRELRQMAEDSADRGDVFAERVLQALGPNVRHKRETR